MSDTIIRTSKHSLLFSNKKKLDNLHNLITEYRRVATIYLNHFWDKGITLSMHKDAKTTYFNFDTNTHLDCPSMISTVELDKEIDLQSTLTARVRKCCVTQVLGIIRGTVEKQRKRQYIVNKKRAECRSISRRLRKAVRKNKPTKPDISKINPEINSLCLDYEENSNSSFNGWLNLHSYTNVERNQTILLPIKEHRHSKKLALHGTRMNSFILTDSMVDIRWEMTPLVNNSTQQVGADQGKKTVLALCDENKRSINTPKKNKDKYSLNRIMKVLERRKKGSKRFKKAQAHRKNFIKWSINQLDFGPFGTIKYESIVGLRYKNPTNREMSHWTYTDIRDKVASRCELENVSMVYDSSTYYSQRCHVCGLVLKSQRKKKVYSCKNCGWEGDADYNSASNHQQNLPDVTGLRNLKLNVKGFYWRTTGAFTLGGERLQVPLRGEEFTVPLSKKVV